MRAANSDPLTFATLTAIPSSWESTSTIPFRCIAVEEEVRVEPRGTRFRRRPGVSSALLIVTFDAVFAFAALWFSKVPGCSPIDRSWSSASLPSCVDLMLTLAILGIREYRVSDSSRRSRNGLARRPGHCLSGLPSPECSAADHPRRRRLRCRNWPSRDGSAFSRTRSSGSIPLDGECSSKRSKRDPVHNQIGVVVELKHPLPTDVSYVSNLTEKGCKAREYGRVLADAGVRLSADKF